MKEFSQPFCLSLADGPSTTQHFSGGTLVAQDRPNILVLQSTFFHKCVQGLAWRHLGQGAILLFLVFDEERQHLGACFLLGCQVIAIVEREQRFCKPRTLSLCAN